MPEYRPIWIAEFLNKEQLREKLGSKYGIDIDEFERLAKFNAELRGFDEFHPEHGLRTVIQIQMSRGRFIRAVIQSIDAENDSWIIRTARYLN